MSELKPCPFCGNVELRVFSDAIDIEFNTKSVVCGKCCAKSPMHNWNARAETTELEQLRKNSVTIRSILSKLKVDAEKVISSLCSTGNDEAWSIIKLNNMITDIDDALAPLCMTCEGDKEITDTEGNAWPCPECAHK